MWTQSSPRGRAAADEARGRAAVSSAYRTRQQLKRDATIMAIQCLRLSFRPESLTIPASSSAGRGLISCS